MMHESNKATVFHYLIAMIICFIVIVFFSACGNGSGEKNTMLNDDKPIYKDDDYDGSHNIESLQKKRIYV